MVLSCISIMWVSNVDVLNGKFRFTITGGIIMRVIEIINEVIVGAGGCRISHP